MNAFVPAPEGETHRRRRSTVPPDRVTARTGWSERAQVALGLIAAVAAILLVVIGALNRSLQADVAAGQARISAAQTAATVNNNLIRLLAKAAAEKNDAGIRDLLARSGITYRAAAPAPPTEGATP